MIKKTYDIWSRLLTCRICGRTFFRLTSSIFTESWNAVEECPECRTPNFGCRYCGGDSTERWTSNIDDTVIHLCKKCGEAVNFFTVITKNHPASEFYSPELIPPQLFSSLKRYYYEVYLDIPRSVEMKMRRKYGNGEKYEKQRQIRNSMKRQRTMLERAWIKTLRISEEYPETVQTSLTPV